MKLVSALLIAGLMAINAALGYAAWELSSSPLRTPGTAPSGRTAGAGLTLPSIGDELEFVDVAAYGELAARPPFTSTRRPMAAVLPQVIQPAPAPVAVIAPLNAELVGVVIDTRRRKALIRVQSEQRPRILKKGDRIGGWRLELIEEKRVVFTQDMEQRELLLRPRP